MKNRIKLIVMLSVVTIVAALFSGCFLANFNVVKSISLVGTPKNVYYVGDEFDASGFQIKIDYKNDKQESVTTDVTADQFDISFSSAKEGTYKCVITLKANANVSLSFDYSVMLRGGAFTEGDGSQSSPYVVYTAEEFSHIGDEAGKYYVLGSNIDLTKATPVGEIYERKCFNMNVDNSFILDGQNYYLSLGGEGYGVFATVKNAKIENLTLNIKPGSNDCTLACVARGVVDFNGLTFNGSMETSSNSGLVTKWFMAEEAVISNCTNNVNMTGTAPYYGAFVGLIYNTLQKITFNNCVNNGNLDGGTAWVFVGNGAQNIQKELNVINCKNNGRLVGSVVGLFNVDGGTIIEATRINKDSYNGTVLAKKINQFTVETNANDFVKVGRLITNGTKDVTLVNENGTVKFNESVASVLNSKLQNGYTVKMFVREWIAEYKDSARIATSYVYSDMLTELTGSIPYARVEIDENKSTQRYETALEISENKIILAGKLGENTVQLQNAGGKSYQYYCYYVYDSNGAMKYCGQIQYENIQNA